MQYDVMMSEERKECAALAARAFADYEYFAAYIPNDRRRKRFLESLMNTEFKVNDGKAVFLTAKESGKTVAVAVLFAPDYIKPSDAQYMKSGYWRALMHGGYKSVMDWGAMEEQAIAPCKEIEDKWYLNMLVVEPACEGKGIGSRMLGECIIPYVKEQGGKTLCLFTNSEINRKFYKKNGFEEFDEKCFSYNGKEIGSWSYRAEL